MTILIDYNHAMISSITGNRLKDVHINENVLRTLFIERLRTIKTKWGNTYGSLLIACDGPNYWRKEYFPYYKHGRKAIKENSRLDWVLLHKVLDEFRKEIEQYFPYKIVYEEGIEADDIIADYIKYHKKEDEKVLIFSGDSDFLQLHKHTNVDQYSPMLQKFLTTDNAIAYLKEKIIRGDPGDGIPNILSPDNIFLREEEQQTKITKKRFDELFSRESLSDMHGWGRNRVLIDFDYIPERIINKIDELIVKQKDKRFVRNDLMTYFINNKQGQFVKNIQDF